MTKESFFLECDVSLVPEIWGQLTHRQAKYRAIKSGKGLYSISSEGDFIIYNLEGEAITKKSQLVKTEGVKHEKEKEFLEEIILLYKRFGFSLGHEDGQGAFKVESYSEPNANWLRDAIIETEKEEE